MQLPKRARGGAALEAAIWSMTTSRVDFTDEQARTTVASIAVHGAPGPFPETDTGALIALVDRLVEALAANDKAGALRDLFAETGLDNQTASYLMFCVATALIRIIAERTGETPDEIISSLVAELAAG